MATIKKAQNGLAKGSKPGEMSGVQISDKDVMTHPQDFQHLKSIPKYKKMLDPKTNKYYPKKAQNGYESNPYTQAQMNKIKGKVLERSIEKKGKEKADSITKGNLDRAKKILKTYKPVSKMKNGGSVSAGTKGQSKRVGSVDPKGAYTKVQKRTLAGAKGKASLTKDKQLGATKMAKCGTCMPKKKK